jgi:hypothetical protein
LLNSNSATVAFGNVTVSSNSVQNITLTNAGTANVTISQVSVAGAGFTASGINGLILIPGQSAVITATFAPSANGSAAGSIAVISNASNSPSVVSLTGTGIAAVTHTVVLSWVGGAAGITGYRAYSSTVSGGPYSSLTSNSFTSSNFTDSTVQSGQTYYYVVTAIGSQNQESAHSAEVVAVVR